MGAFEKLLVFSFKKFNELLCDKLSFDELSFDKLSCDNQFTFVFANSFCAN